MKLEIDTGTVYCVCGCGEEADQLFKGIPVPDTNPMTHYRNYQRQLVVAQEEARLKLQLGSHTLEHLTPETFVMARRGM